MEGDRRQLLNNFFQNPGLEEGAGRTPKRCASFFTFFLFLCKWWWEIKTKEAERKKKEEGVLEG